MSVERLRLAATKIRETANAATPGPWTADPVRPRYITTAAPIDIDEADWGPEGHTAYRLGTMQDPNAWRYADVTYIALMSPPVALAMADWLDEAADMIDAEDVGQSDHPLRIANLILGAP